MRYSITLARGRERALNDCDLLHHVQICRTFAQLFSRQAACSPKTQKWHFLFSMHIAPLASSFVVQRLVIKELNECVGMSLRRAALQFEGLCGISHVLAWRGTE